MGRYSNYWPEYVPVAKRKEQAAQKVAKMKKQGKNIFPIVIEGRKITHTFWGKAWCDNLESYSDYENRLPRGRTYVRNGSVVHLDIAKGNIKAMVSGSSMYDVKITISPLKKEKWKKVVTSCSGSIGSLVELLQGQFSKSVMQVIIDKDNGLFPSPDEIKVECNCYDYATMCKHVAAVMYGVGARLDSQPELLFTLRQTDHFELLSSAAVSSNLDKASAAQDDLDAAGLSALFGIDIEESANANVADKPKTVKSKAKTKSPARPKIVKAKESEKAAKAKAVKGKAKMPTKIKVAKNTICEKDFDTIAATVVADQKKGVAKLKKIPTKKAAKKKMWI